MSAAAVDQIEKDRDTYMSHWKPVNVPSMAILTGRPFHRPANPMFL